MTSPLSSYVSDYVARQPGLPADSTEWSCARRQAVFLFADISGFSQLANRLASHGPEGAEELNRLLNVYFERLIDLIYQWGGDVVRFAGDAVLAIWDAGDAERGTALVEGNAALSDHARRAAACGAAIQAALQNYEVGVGVRLSVRVTLGAGIAQAALLGGVGDSWQALFFGEPLDQIRRGDALAAVGDVVISAEVAAMLDELFEGEPLADGFLRLVAAPMVAPPDARPQPPWRAESRRFVAQPVLARADAGQIEWMADLRRVSVIFVSILGVESSEAPEKLLHECLLVLQQAMAAHGGTVLQLICDDKGTVGVLCVGLPPVVQANSAQRAVAAATSIVSELAARALTACIGISTGDVFCGPLGGQRRREYAIIGDVVNLSARLMQNSASGVLCDAATAKALAGDATLSRLPSHRLKGLAGLTEVFRIGASDAMQTSWVNRDDELQWLSALAEQGDVRLVVITGPAGIGKSALARRVANQWKEEARACWATANEVDARTPLTVWRELLWSALRIRRRQDLEHLHAELLAQCGAVGREDRVSLLNLFMGTTFPEQPFVQQLDGEHVQSCAFELIELLLGRSLPWLCCIDDAHWMDDASWSLIQRLLANLPGARFWLVMRPWESGPPPQYEQLSRRQDAQRLDLRPLRRDDALRLICLQLGVEQLDSALEDHLWDHSQGNPHFAREIAEYLRDENLVVMEYGRCGLVQQIAGHGLNALPPSVREVTAARIDRLGPAEQLTVKSASVLGAVFEDEGVQAVFPVLEQSSRVPVWLEDLSDDGMLRPLIESLPPRHAFSQLTTQRVAYYQLPRAQRRQLHARAAEWIETHHLATPGKHARLAYHWQHAGDHERHRLAAAEAGADAFHAGSYRDAVAFLQQAIELHEASCGDDPSREQRQWRAHYARLLAEAWFSLGDLALSSSLLNRSLQLSRGPVRRGAWAVRCDSLRLMIVQAWRLWRRKPLPLGKPDPWGGPPSGDGMKLPSGLAPSSTYDCVLAHERLAQICYFNNNVAIGVNHALRALHQAESLPPTPALARCYANMTVAMQVTGMDWLCSRYVQRALATARHVNQPGPLAYVLNVVNVVQLGRGQWDQVAEHAKEALTAARRLNDPHAASESITVMAMLHCLRGQYAEAAAAFQALLDNAELSDNELHRVWAWNGLGEVALRSGDAARAVKLLDRAARQLPTAVSPTEEVRVHGLAALAYLRSGDEASARASWRRGQNTLAACNSLTMSSLEGVSGLVSAASYFHARSPLDELARREFDAAMQGIKRLAKRYRLARPRAQRFLARQAALRGKNARATRFCQHAARVARDLGLPLDEALALHEQARITQDEFLMKDARETFERLQASFETAACDLHGDSCKQLLA